MAFDTSMLNEKNFRDSLEKLEELISHSKAVLFGAGASCCAGLPLTNQLTEKVLASDVLSEESKRILNAIQASFAGAKPASHIEDYLSELVDWLAITSRRVNREIPKSEVTIGGLSYSHQNLALAVDEIKKAISDEIVIKVDSSVHERFVRALHRPIRPGKDSALMCVDYLVMNYDTLIEDALALSRIHYADGLSGGASGWWDSMTFDGDGLKARVLKLHGSVDWAECPGSTMPIRIAPCLKRNDDAAAKIMIWPASTKYRETQLDPYAHLLSRARSVLNPRNGGQRVFLIVGYSFGDAHINFEIERGLRTSNGNLTVIVFTSDAEPRGLLARWHQDSSISEQLLIYANNGFYHASQEILSQKSIEWWKFENLTQILEGSI